MEGDENEAACAEERVSAKRFRTSQLQSLRLARDDFQGRSATTGTSPINASRHEPTRLRG